MNNNTIHFQIDGNVYSESFSNKLEAMFFLEKCGFTIISAKVGRTELNAQQIEEVIRKGKAYEWAIDNGMPLNFHSILYFIDWYGEMAEKARKETAFNKAQRECEMHEIGQLEMEQNYITKA
ncbi:hypothetical protein [Mongoliitalea daihaiensis]|uniref:hypothetical protein n=1 Tax=Mongoliitalea daihaiensis TaxID=2782006 RepID=UPI001F3DA684|nr:hypothetical protein [Mongoliitalea daihaiensis]UJP64022.1 hypothetical protein IPZ59_14505 [Mongoliitalea daihaiensis]